jgi:hypothetical protein
MVGRLQDFLQILPSRTVGGQWGNHPQRCRKIADLQARQRLPELIVQLPGQPCAVFFARRPRPRRNGAQPAIQLAKLVFGLTAGVELRFQPGAAVAEGLLDLQMLAHVGGNHIVRSSTLEHDRLTDHFNVKHLVFGRHVTEDRSKVREIGIPGDRLPHGVAVFRGTDVEEAELQEIGAGIAVSLERSDIDGEKLQRLVVENIGRDRKQVEQRLVPTDGLRASRLYAGHSSADRSMPRGEGRVRGQGALCDSDL